MNTISDPQATRVTVAPSSSTHQRSTGISEEDCDWAIDKVYRQDVFLKFILEKLSEAGCSLGRDAFEAQVCAESVAAGFDKAKGKVILCRNHLNSKPEVADAMRHEALHAYDYCTARDLDWDNLDDRACSEIRAAALSGDCSRTNELWRGNFALLGQYKACVKRRAALSFAGLCPGGEQQAKDVVERNFDTCFHDTRPFASHPSRWF